jgi:formylglycine-generating enzyme required for sulfatase activity
MVRALCISAIIGIALTGCTIFESEESDMPGGLRIAGGGLISFANCDEPCIGITTNAAGLNVLYFSSNRTNAEMDRPGGTYRVYRCEQARADSEIYRPPVLVEGSDGMCDFAVIAANGADYLVGTKITDNYSKIYVLRLTNENAGALTELTGGTNNGPITGRVVALLPKNACLGQHTVNGNFALVYQPQNSNSIGIAEIAIQNGALTISFTNLNITLTGEFAGGGSYVPGTVFAQNPGITNALPGVGSQATGFLLYARSAASGGIYITDFGSIDLPLDLFTGGGRSPIYAANENKVYMTSTRTSTNANIYRWNRTKLDAAFADALGKRVYSGTASSVSSANRISSTASSASSVSDASSAVGVISVPTHAMVRISAGSFSMGSPTNETNRGGIEDRHLVRLTKDFYIGKYQVTQELYQLVMESNPSHFANNPAADEAQEKRPVENVSWYDALVFCNKLSALGNLTPVYSISGSTNTASWGDVPTINNTTWNAVIMDGSANGYRLPTEAEWEYACRAGSTTAYNLGGGSPWNGDWGWYGGVSGNSGGMTHEVGKKTPNNWGLYDMHGNVLEWCWDWFFQSYDTAPGVGSDPTGPTSGTNRVARGGSWNNTTNDPGGIDHLRSAYRDYYPPQRKESYIGFRVVRTAQ